MIKESVTFCKHISKDIESRTDLFYIVLSYASCLAMISVYLKKLFSLTLWSRRLITSWSPAILFFREHF